ncbi:hypothetical protein H7E67_19415 [Clostridium gasigenes]|uniref:hypothetical protein n=1 Tax=Clostridium gasigenes TaxID=94869 RepID=UPI0016281A13|nr:hypothetical protein [Clostridium gasigenes]MBB6625572.1 hypothetical protein [Clostridium gasigenes]
MKKFRKTLSTLTLSVVAVLLLSTVASATVDYNFQLPSTGSKYTEFENKSGSGSTAYNYADYVGWSDTINCWVNDNSSNQLTGASAYNRASTVSMYYAGSNGSNYYGHQVQMQIKTGTAIFHDIDVRGRFKG